MSWRRFSALLQGLGPHSAYRLTLQHGSKIVQGADAEAHVEALLG